MFSRHRSLIFPCKTVNTGIHHQSTPGTGQICTDITATKTGNTPMTGRQQDQTSQFLHQTMQEMHTILQLPVLQHTACDSCWNWWTLTANYQLPTLCLNKNVSILSSCSFNKHGLILTVFGKYFGKQHRHTFKNDVPIWLSLFLHFYLLYLLLNSSDGNDAMLTSLTVVNNCIQQKENSK